MLGKMKIITIIEIVVVVILFFLLIIAMHTRRTGKAKLVLSVFLINGVLLCHMGISYCAEGPKITLQGDQVVFLTVEQEYEEPGVVATYRHQDISDQIHVSGEVKNHQIGTYEKKYQYDYQGKQLEVKRTIIIQDTIAPKIKLKGRKQITLYPDETYHEPGYVVEDNVDDDLMEKVKIEKQLIAEDQYKLIYTVSDSSGNQAKVERMVTLSLRSPENENQHSNNGIIYLTFDDGPSLTITPQLLSILKQENIQATFFILNYDTNSEGLVKQIVEDGHTIAIHGYSHDYQQIYQSVDSYLENVTKLQDKIKQTTGVTTTITRFPGGSSNTISRFNPHIMSTLTKEVVKKGFRYYDWNVSSGDAGEAKNKQDVYENVTKELMRNGNNIVLMHDFAKNTKTLEALPDIIRYGKENGYTFEKITEDTPMITHHVNN